MDIPSIEFTIMHAGHKIGGTFSGGEKSWVFKSFDEYFRTVFPECETSFNDALKVKQLEPDDNKRLLHQEVWHCADLLTSRAEYAFDGRYDNLVGFIEALKFSDFSDVNTYVIAPTGSRGLRRFTDEYTVQQGNSDFFRPQQNQELTIYQVTRDYQEVPNEATDYIFERLYDKSITHW